MVTSGLFDRLDVSPVRLAIHLWMALLILALTLWTAMGAFAWPGRPSSLGMPRAMALSVAALIFVQAMFGALLAGADGGAAYADWPRIGGEWLPSSAFGLEPIWRNFSEDHATQHLLHRNLGYVVALTALVVALGALFRGSGAARWCAILLGLAAVTQAGLGIVTVLGGSTLTPSLLHQGAAVLLWTTSIATARAAVVT